MSKRNHSYFAHLDCKNNKNKNKNKNNKNNNRTQWLENKKMH